MNYALKSYIRNLLGWIGLRPTSRYPFVRRANTYLNPTYPSNVLSRDFFSSVQLKASNDAGAVNKYDIYKVWKEIPGAHKWLHYFETYQSAISRFDGRPIRMLEIGVYKGGSLRMWRNYLQHESLIVGIDIDQKCHQYERQEENVFVRIGDQSSREFLKDIIREFGPFDFILDDGSHMCSHMIASFNYLYLDGLNDGGVYLVEDAHSNFWESHRDRTYSFIDLAKDLVDFMHAHYWGHQAETYFREGHPLRAVSIQVPRIAAEIGGISFEDSLVTIYKSKKSNLPISVHL